MAGNAKNINHGGAEGKVEAEAELSSEFAGLRGDTATADLKILTKDGKEILAHKVIFKGQSRVFESMIASNSSGNKADIIEAKEVTSETMEIILHFLYSGELLPTWKDVNCVLEFTTVVGKYQMANILKLLDAKLGTWRDGSEPTPQLEFELDFQLLKLADKLELKTPKKHLIQKINKHMARLTRLYGINGSNQLSSLVCHTDN